MVGRQTALRFTSHVTRIRHDGGVYAGKVGEHLPGAHLAFSGKEVTINVSSRLMVVIKKRSDILATGVRSIVS